VSNRNEKQPAPTRHGETRVVARFEIPFTRCLGPDGDVIGTPPPIAREHERLSAFYREMVRLRAFDQRAVALQRTGQLGTYPSCLGQDAIGVGVGTALWPEDVLVPSYREQAAQFARGVTLEELLRYWGGDERGSDFAGPREDFPVCIPIGTQAAHAAGVAAAFRLRREPRVAVCVAGDGATSRGDFYEALNLAGVWRLPVVFVVANNQWAISVPRSAQSAAETLAQKAVAAGFEGLQVDGNDLVAVRFEVERALDKARRGDGPTLIEALTYRLGDHTTADDARRYRSEDEVEARRRLDPLLRTRRLLEAVGHWDEGRQRALEIECVEQVEAAVERYLATPPAGPEAMFDHLHATLPAALEPQREAALGGVGEDEADG
jgi:2-oxoisovalerate dehydrogenase E1 component alpha subunit